VACSASLNGKKINASCIFENSPAKRLLGALRNSCELVLEVVAPKFSDGKLTKEETLPMNQVSIMHAPKVEDLKTQHVYEKIKDMAEVRHAVQVPNLANIALLEHML